jgi:N,N'-diacetyllegionaminate synthase
MLKKFELSRADHYALVEHCQVQGVQFLSTAFDEESLAFLIELDVPLLKVPSGEITNLPFLRQVGSAGIPVVVSTGMATMNEVYAAVEVLTTEGVRKQDLTVLQCTTDYPTRAEDVNLKAMVAMREELGLRVGLSDHTLGIEVSIAAVALGATVIEKHITLSRSLSGPDHGASLEPLELKEMVRAIRNIEKAMGEREKKPSAVEEENRRVVRKSIVAKQPIKRGEEFSEDNITAKRPGTGLSPMEWDNVLGREAGQDYAVDDLIS